MNGRREAAEAYQRTRNELYSDWSSDDDSDDEGNAFFTAVRKADAPRDGKLHGGWQPMKIFGLVVLWWTSAVGVTLTIKSTISNLSDDASKPPLFPHPIFLTAMTNMCAGVMLYALMTLLYLIGVMPKSEGATRGELTRLVLIGLMQGACNSLTNSALKFLSVSLRTVLLSNFPLMQMVTARMWGIEQLGCLRLLAGLLLFAGGCTQTHDAKEGKTWLHLLKSPDEQAEGIGLLLFGMLLGAQQWALTQQILHHADPKSALKTMTKVELSARLLPASGLMCFMISLAFDHGVYEDLFAKFAPIGTRVVFIGAGIALITVSELMLVQLTSAVALQVISSLHQFPVLIVAVSWYGETLKWPMFLGFGLCFLGALAYMVARRGDQKQEPCRDGRRGRVAVDLTNALGRSAWEDEKDPRASSNNSLPVGATSPRVVGRTSLKDTGAI